VFLLHGLAGMESGLASGIAVFLRDVSGMLSNIRVAIQVRECGRLCDALHALKGTAAMFSADPVARLCLEIEGADGRPVMSRSHPRLSGSTDPVQTDLPVVVVRAVGYSRWPRCPRVGPVAVSRCRNRSQARSLPRNPGSDHVSD
jgi:HPt (histidine-containing phosphotransfer) domain-containing protein